MNKKIVVIADIHSNSVAFKAALDMIDKLEPYGLIFLGDYISDCPYPQRTMELLYSCRERYRCWFVRGNREEYMLRHRQSTDDGWHNGSGTGSLLYAYENLTERDLDFFESMPICVDIELEDCPVITACHGSPQSAKDWIIEAPDRISECARAVRGEVLLCGHVHRSRKYCAASKQVVFCPSVGIPSDEFLTALTLLELIDGMWQCEELPVEYDKQLLLSQFGESGLIDRAPVWSMCNMKQIVEGRDYSIECVTLAGKKAADNGYVGADIPERFWIEAARELGVI